MFGVRCSCFSVHSGYDVVAACRSICLWHQPFCMMLVRKAKQGSKTVSRRRTKCEEPTVRAGLKSVFTKFKSTLLQLLQPAKRKCG